MPLRSFFRKKISFLLFLTLFLAPSIDVVAQPPDVYTNLGINGGLIEAIAIDPSSPDRMFVGTYLGDGLVTSSNGGTTWRPVVTNGMDPHGEDVFSNQDVFDIQIAPSDPRIVWASHNNWVEKSTDGGKTWGHILNSLMQRDCPNCGGLNDSFRFCISLAIDPQNPEIVYVGTSGFDGKSTGGSIYKTLDGGKNWKKLNGGQDFDFTVVEIALDPQNRNVLWAATAITGETYGGTLYRSGDGGESFETVLSLTPFKTSFESLAVKPNDSNTVFTGSRAGLIKHTFNETTKKWDFTFPALKGSGFTYDIAFSPTDPETLAVSWNRYEQWGGDSIGKVSISRNGGADWETFPLGNSKESTLEFRNLVFHPTQQETLFGGDWNDGLFKSTDRGKTWTSLSNGINAVLVHDVKNNPRKSGHLLAATGSGVFQKNPEGPWEKIKEGYYTVVEFHPSDDQILYAGPPFSKTLDGGATWSSTILPDVRVVTEIAVNPENPATLFISLYTWGSGGKIFKSIDGGENFSEVLSGEDQAENKYNFNTVAIVPKEPNHIFAGGGNFFDPPVPGALWESIDGGENWRRTSLTKVIVNALLIDPENPHVMFAGVGDSSTENISVYKSTDGGKTWNPSSFGIADQIGDAVVDLVFDRSDTSIVYGATLSAGIYVSPFAGKKWVNLGTPLYSVFSIASGSLYAGTKGGLLQLTGTGTLFGEVKDYTTNNYLDKAAVSSDSGLETRTIEGEYLFVLPSGNYEVTSRLAGYLDNKKGDILIPGGEVIRQNFNMKENGGQLPPPTLTYPEPNASLAETTVTFQWSAKKPDSDVTYYLHVSETADFANAIAVTVKKGLWTVGNFPVTEASLLLCGIIFWRRKSKKNIPWLLLLLFTATLLSCGGGSKNDEESTHDNPSSTTPPPANGELKMSATVDNLKTNVPYFWKVSLSDGGGSNGETEVRTFTITGN